MSEGLSRGPFGTYFCKADGVEVVASVPKFDLHRLVTWIAYNGVRQSGVWGPSGCRSVPNLSYTSNQDTTNTSMQPSYSTDERCSQLVRPLENFHAYRTVRPYGAARVSKLGLLVLYLRLVPLHALG